MKLLQLLKLPFVSLRNFKQFYSAAGSCTYIISLLPGIFWVYYKLCLCLFSNYYHLYLEELWISLYTNFVLSHITKFSYYLLQIFIWFSLIFYQVYSHIYKFWPLYPLSNFIFYFLLSNCLFLIILKAQLINHIFLSYKVMRKVTKTYSGLT